MSSSLPYELWSKIFHLVNSDRSPVQPKQTKNPHRPSYEIRSWEEWPTHRIRTLSHVCRDWRSAIMDDHGLWSYFAVYAVTTSRRVLAASLWEKEIALSGTHGLTLDIVFDTNFSWISSKLGFFLRYQDRWESATVSVTNQGMGKFLSNVIAMPRLKRLHFENPYTQPIDSQFPPIHLPDLSFPSLTDFKVNVGNDQMGKMRLPLAHLKRFTYCGKFEDLATLQTYTSLRCVEEINLVHLFASRADNQLGPHLDLDPRSCNVDWSAISTAWSNLGSLHVQTNDEIVHELIVHNLTLPKLTHLSLKGMSGDTVLKLPQFLERCGNRLVQFEIGALRLKGGPVCQLLPHLPMVDTLQICDTKQSAGDGFEASELFDALQVHTDMDAQCPNLERFTIVCGKFTASSLVSMLESRLLLNHVQRRLSAVILTSRHIVGDGDEVKGLSQKLTWLEKHYSCSIKYSRNVYL